MSASALTPSFFYAPYGTDLSGHDDLKLCIEIGDDHMAYTVSDAAGKKISAFSYFQSQSDTLFQDLEWLLNNGIPANTLYTDVILLINTNRVVLVPEQFYKEHLSETILEAIHGDIGLVSVHSDSIHQWEIAAIYGIEKTLENLVLEKFPQSRTVHFVSPALRHAFRNMDLTVKQTLKLYFYRDCFLAMAFTGDQLQIMQHFYFETTEDILYHLLNLVEKYRLDVTEIQVNVSGHLETDSNIWEELKKHFLEISLEETMVSEEVRSDFPSHYFTPFFMVPTCV